MVIILGSLARTSFVSGTELIVKLEIIFSVASIESVYKVMDSFQFGYLYDLK
jgi:hypothetical protein